MSPHSQGRPRAIVFIRHGQSVRNALGPEGSAITEEGLRIIGDMNDHEIPLTPEGLRQAEDSGPGIVADIGLPDYVYHSGYVRAQQTADALLRHLDPGVRATIRIRHNIRLRERDPGYLWRMTLAEQRVHFPWNEEYARRMGKLFTRPPGGESIMDVYDGRLYNLLGAIIRDRVGKTVWLVCHGHVMRAARIMMDRLTIPEAHRMADEPIHNLAVSRYEYEPGATQPRRTHLNRVYWSREA